MKICRTRAVSPYRCVVPVYGGGTRTVWSTWTEIETLNDVDVMQLDRNFHFPGLQFMLRIPMTDPETGTDRDVDGDLALLRIRMIGGELDYTGGYLVFRGFVSNEELEHERVYRDCAGDHNIRHPASDYEYVR